MIILKSTDLLRFRLATTGVNPLPFTAYGVTIGSSLAPTNYNGVSSGTTNVTIFPTGANAFQVKGISIYNADTVQNTVTVELYDGTNARIILAITLNVGDTLHYSDVDMWFVTDNLGNRKVTTTASAVYSALTTNAYITWTYTASSGTIVGVPIADTTVQREDIYSNGKLIGSRRAINIQDTDDDRYVMNDDAVNNMVTIQNYDNRNMIGLMRSLLFELNQQGFYFVTDSLNRELNLYTEDTNK